MNIERSATPLRRIGEGDQIYGYDIENRPLHMPLPTLCGHCAGSGQENLDYGDYGGTVVCRHCHGSGLEHSEPCRRCNGSGLIVNRNRNAQICSTCGGVGRMPNVRLSPANPNVEVTPQTPVRSYTPYQAHLNAARATGMIENFRRLYGSAEERGIRLDQPQMSYEYAPPADADTAVRSELLVSEASGDQLDALAANFSLTRRNALSTSAAIEGFRNAIMEFSSAVGSDTSPSPEITQKPGPHPKRLNRFQILKLT